MLRHIVVPIHSAGWPLIAAALVVALLLTWAWTPLFWPGLLLVAFVAFFFRDPPRVTPLGDSLVVSPADGHVWAIGEAAPPPELEMGSEERTRVSIFLSVILICLVMRVPNTQWPLMTIAFGLFLMGLADDIRGLRAGTRLALELADGLGLRLLDQRNRPGRGGRDSQGNRRAEASRNLDRRRIAAQRRHRHRDLQRPARLAHRERSGSARLG